MKRGGDKRRVRGKGRKGSGKSGRKIRKENS